MANTQINITENGTTTLATAGKYCDKNIDVNVNVQNGGSIETATVTLVGMYGDEYPFPISYVYFVDADGVAHTQALTNEASPYVIDVICPTIIVVGADPNIQRIVSGSAELLTTDTNQYVYSITGNAQIQLGSSPPVEPQ